MCIQIWDCVCVHVWALKVYRSNGNENKFAQQTNYIPFTSLSFFIYQESQTIIMDGTEKNVLRWDEMCNNCGRSTV